MENQRRIDEFVDIVINPFDWHAYNNSQMKEKILFFQLLDDICNYVDNDKFKRRCRLGRTPRSDSFRVFCMCLKTYINTSSRRVIGELELCSKAGYITDIPHFNSVVNYFNDSAMKHILRDLIELSAIPLARLEKKFAVDSTGFSMHQFEP